MTTLRRTFLVALTLTSSACADHGDADERRYMFDLEHDEIEAIAAVYAPEADPEELALQLEAPFDCEMFGDACARLGVDRAELLVEEVWTLARAGAPSRALHDAAVAEFSAPQQSMAAGSSAAAVALCPGVPLGTLQITVSKSTLGLLAYGEVAYVASRHLVGPVPLTVPDPVDASIDLEITTPVGTTIFSSTTATVAAASASVGRLVFAPFIRVSGNVDATGCPPVGAEI